MFQFRIAYKVHISVFDVCMVLGVQPTSYKSKNVQFHRGQTGQMPSETAVTVFAVF